MISEMPYFAKNKDWYNYVTHEDGTISIEFTEAAPPEALESYKEWRERVERRRIKLELEDE